jgi:hypothetical protein
MNGDLFHSTQIFVVFLRCSQVWAELYGDYLIRKDMEGSRRGVIEILYWYFSWSE